MRRFVSPALFAERDTGVGVSPFNPPGKGEDVADKFRRGALLSEDDFDFLVGNQFNAELQNRLLQNVTGR